MVSRRQVVGRAGATAVFSVSAGVLSPWAQVQALASSGGYAIVLNSRDASVSLIDMERREEVGRVEVGKEPHHLYPTPDNRQLIVANAVSNDMHMLDPLSGQVSRRIRNIDDPYQIAFSPDQKWFVAAALRLNRVDIYANEGGELKISKRIPVLRSPSHLWFSADSKLVFATLQDSNEVVAIDMQSQAIAWRMPTGALAAGIMVTPDDKFIYVGCMGVDYVQVIDWRAQKTVNRIKTGNGAHNFRGLGDKRTLFVSNRVAGTVSAIDMNTQQVIDTFAVPGGPDCIEVPVDQKTLWITSRFARQVSVVDVATRKVMHRINVGRSPHGIYIHQRAALL